MATFRAFAATDMLDFTTSVGDIRYLDSKLLVVETWNSETYYYGRFSYPGDEWRGTVTKIQNFDAEGELEYDARGLDISTNYVTVGARPGAAQKAALRDDDRIIGSRYDDRLAGFDGDDLIRAGRGDDRLLGQDGRDRLEGAAGDDDLRGGRGADALVGGRGDDILRGEGARDVFVFAGRDGSDRIVDFNDGRDMIEIAGGADWFGDLWITEKRGHALVAFAETGILLRGVSETEIDAGDFVFT